jgi:hypothetical protein
VKRLGLDAEQSVDLMTEMVARWCEDHFGPLPGEVIATVNQVGAALARLQDRAERAAHGKQPRKVGRKATSRELADFAHANRQLTMKEIAERWNKKHPTRKKVKAEEVRGAYRRAYGDKARPAKKKRAE